MKVGLDLDYTITAAPEFFRVLAKALIESGHEVHIITYRDSLEDTKRDIQDLDMPYTELHLPVGEVEPHVWKAEMAKKLGLAVMIDDAPEVIAAMPKGVLRLWLADPEVFDMNKCVKALKEVPKMDIVK